MFLKDLMLVRDYIWWKNEQFSFETDDGPSSQMYRPRKTVGHRVFLSLYSTRGPPHFSSIVEVETEDESWGDKVTSILPWVVERSVEDVAPHLLLHGPSIHRYHCCRARFIATVAKLAAFGVHGDSSARRKHGYFVPPPNDMISFENRRANMEDLLSCKWFWYWKSGSRNKW